MTVLNLTRALIAIVLAALCLGAGYGVSRLVTPRSTVLAPDSQKLIGEGYELFDAGEFEKAEERFQTASKLLPESGEVWFMLGMFRHYDKNYDEARANFEKAIRYEYRPGLAHFNIGCGYSLLGKKEQAIYELQQAVKAGLVLRSHFATDPDLKALHDEPEYQALLASLQHPLHKYPDAVAMERRIGSWDVFNQENRFRGTLRSAMTLNGFGIEENLISATGLSEQSFFVFNEKDKTWMCTFADGKGAIGQFKGKVKDGVLTVSGPMTGSQKGYRRITIMFLPEGVIREVHEAADAEKGPYKLIDTYLLKQFQG